MLQQLQARWPAAVVPLGADEETTAHRLHRFQRLRLRVERWIPAFGSGVRVASTACWEFPIYSQTFVYQELSELVRGGFRLRFLYSKLNPRSFLPQQFSRVWHAKRKLFLHYTVCESDYAYYCERMPEKVRSLVAMVQEASGITPEELQNHYHFKQAFAFTRTVEACRPDYLHSYFFYEGALFTLFASYLLDIPRGVSCYADHMLDDYVLKVVPLHIRQCGLVIATSNRIKRELMAIAPTVDPHRIVVKPNAIDSKRFPATVRTAPMPKALRFAWSASAASSPKRACSTWPKPSACSSTAGTTCRCIYSAAWTTTTQDASTPACLTRKFVSSESESRSIWKAGGRARRSSSSFSWRTCSLHPSSKPKPATRMEFLRPCWKEWRSSSALPGSRYRCRLHCGSS